MSVSCSSGYGWSARGRCSGCNTRGSAYAGCWATDDFVWEVCFNTVVDEQQMYGYDILPAPALHPRASREFLRALVAVKLGIGMRKVDLKALDRAYSAAFPHSTPLNVNKKKREPPGWRDRREWRDGRDIMMPTMEKREYLKQGNS